MSSLASRFRKLYKAKKLCEAKNLEGPPNKSKSRHCVCGSVDNANQEYPQIWEKLRLQKKYCDAVIHTTDKKSFFVHRAILSACSPYFMSLFSDALRTGEPESRNIQIALDSEMMELVISFAYTGSCRITAENVQRLLTVADQYNILGIIQKCSSFILKELTYENCLGILRFSKHHFCSELENRCLQFVRRNFRKVFSESREFNDLALEELQSLLSDDEIDVRNEETVFMAIIKWVEVNEDERKKHLATLLNCPRYGMMTSRSFMNLVLDNKYIKQDKVLLDMLRPAETFLEEMDMLDSSEVDHSNPLAKPRVPHEILFAIGGWHANGPTNLMETYDTRADKWFLSSHPDVTRRAYHGVCALDRHIYVIGGFDKKEFFNSVRRYDPATYKWEEKACMYQPRCYVSVCALGGNIYAMGGFNGETRINSAERYHATINQWEMLPNMIEIRSDASAASVNGKVYIAGGFNGQIIHSSGEVFDPETFQWTYLPSMIHPRSGFSIIGHKDRLYAFGGYNGITRLNSGEVCDLTQEKAGWKEISEMFHPRSNFSTAVIDDMIFVVGGFNGSKTIPYVECYDFVNDDWYDAAPMNLSRSALSVCVVSELPNSREYSYLARKCDIGKS